MEAVTRRWEEVIEVKQPQRTGNLKIFQMANCSTSRGPCGGRGREPGGRARPRAACAVRSPACCGHRPAGPTAPPLAQVLERGAHRQPLCFELAPASAPGARGARANGVPRARGPELGRAGTESSAGIRGTREQDLGTEAGERGEGAGGIGQGPGRCLGTGARGQRWGGRMQPGSSRKSFQSRDHTRDCYVFSCIGRPVLYY